MNLGLLSAMATSKIPAPPLTESDAWACGGGVAPTGAAFVCWPRLLTTPSRYCSARPVSSSFCLIAESLGIDALGIYNVLMSISESISADQIRDEAERYMWSLGDYEDYGCPHCGRVRLCKCPNGKHRCEKCNWVPEDNFYAPIR